MKKLIVFNMVTLDGFYAGPNDEIDWHNTDEEFGKFANVQTAEFGAMIFGRKTYDLMASFWPTEEARKSDPIVAGLMNTTPKIVFSKTLQTIPETPYWKNITLLSEITPEEIKQIKRNYSKDIAVFGSGTIVQQLTNLGLVDEYRLMINPVILGKGKSLFANMEDKVQLKLINTRKFGNGNILLYYALA